MVRTDKLSIIADAVKEVTKLRAESHQLRQLNKFLEVRTGPSWARAPACVCMPAQCVPPGPAGENAPADAI